MGKDNTKKPSAILFIFFLTAFVLIGYFFFIKYLNHYFDSESKDILVEEQEEMKREIKAHVDEKFQLLNYIANGLDGQFDLETAVEKIKQDSNVSSEDNIGVADIDGNAIFLNGAQLDVSDEDFFKRSIQFEKNVIQAESRINDNEYCVYCTGVYEGLKCVGVVFVFESKAELTEMLHQESYMIGENSGLVERDGTIVAGGIYNLFECTDNTIFASQKIKQRDIDLIYREVKNNYNEILKIDMLDSNYAINAVSVDVDDWVLLSVIDLESEKKGKIIFLTNIMVASLLILYMSTMIFIMISQSKNKKELEKIVYSDELTGGISFEKFKMDVLRLVGSNSEDYAIIDIDVDGFKIINDIFGYEEGNKVIKTIWEEINKEIGSAETFAHRNADEFVAMFKYKDNKQLLTRIEKINKSVIENSTDNQKNYELKLSAGVYYIDRKNFQLDYAIDWAVLAKKTIKGNRNMFYATFDERIRDRVLRKSYIESMMKKAIEKEEFKVYYQPKFNSKTGKLAGAEALVRWYSQVEGVIFPGEFIPVFEENGFITELDKYMFEHVCRDIKKWLDEGLNVVPVSVNLSQLQMYNARFIDEYEAIIMDKGIPSEYVQLELTETTLFAHEGKLNEIMDHLHAIGFKILMDDFGTGYSSLNMLKDAKVDILKLDKSFVDDIGQKKGDIVVSTIVSLGQSLNMKVVAEGVETKEQFEFLKSIYCDEIQGYYFSKPVTVEEYEEMLKKGAL